MLHAALPLRSQVAISSRTSQLALYFVRIAVPCGRSWYNLAGFLDFLLHPQKRSRQRSSPRKQTESTLRP